MSKTEKTPNYSAAQEQLIRDAAEKGVLNIAVATALAANPAMNAVDGTPRKPASIVAKISRMGLAYERKQPTTKTGEPVTKKTDLVAQIAELAGVNVATLDGMEKSPKGSLQALVAALGEQIVFEPEAVNG